MELGFLLLSFFVEGNLDRANTGVDRVEGAQDTEELRIQAQDILSGLEVLQKQVALLVYIQVVIWVTTTHRKRQRQ